MATKLELLLEAINEMNEYGIKDTEEMGIMTEGVSKDDYKQITVNLWDKEISLNIDFDKFKGEDILDSQFKAVDGFKHNIKNISRDSYKSIKSYCEQKYSNQVTDDFENIFRYVKPKTLYVKRSTKKICGILCNFKMDPEHGLVVYIDNGKVTKIGQQDIIL